MNKKIEALLKILITTTFFVPLVVVPSSYIFPFIVPKILWFRSLVLLMSGGFILLLASNWQQYKVRLTGTTIAVALFFLSFSISTFVGVDWYRSFWDNHERMLGLFTIFHFILYYFISTSVVKEWKDWRWLLRMFLFAGSIVMIIGGLQRINPEILLNRGSDRVSATLGNAIYFSGYGLFLMCVGLLLVFKEKGFWRWYAGISAFLGFMGIFWGGTRGTLLGLLAGSFVAGIGYLITLKEYKKIRVSIGAVLGLLVVVLLSLFLFRQTNFVKNIPGVGRLLSTSFSVGDSTNTRIMAWGIAVESWKEKPLFGWGPNNFYFAFNKYYRPEFLESGWGETWFDNAHSAIFNTLAVQGMLGLVVYVGLFAVPLCALWKGWRRGTVDQHIVVISSAFLIGHFVHNATVFENPTSYLYFFFFLAFVNSQTTQYSLPISNGNKIESKNLKIEYKDIPLGLSVVVVFLVLLTIYSTNINSARANKAALRAIRASYDNSSESIQLYKEAIQIPSPHVDDIRNDFARAVEANFSALIKKNKTDAHQYFDLVYLELEKNRQLHPLDIRINLQEAQMDFVWAQINQDMRSVSRAEERLADALEKSPKRQQIIYMLASLDSQIGKTEDSIQLLRQSITDDPKISAGWVQLISLYNTMGKPDEAKKLLDEAIQKHVYFSKDEQKTLENSLGINISATSN